MIQLNKTALDQMIDDAVKTFPDECCGFLFGREEGADRVISHVLVVNNSQQGDKRRRFEIAPKDYLGAEAFADSNGLQLLGIYHSHPNHPAVPSEHDRIAAQPYFSYVIISIVNGTFDHLRSWQLNEAFQFDEELIDPFINN